MARNLWDAAAANDIPSLLARLHESDTFVDLAKDLTGITALHTAISNDHFEATKVLLENGANVNMKDKENGYTPLHFSMINGNIRIIILLIDNGAILGENTPDLGSPWRKLLKYQKKHTKNRHRSQSEDVEDTILDHDGLSPLSFLLSLPFTKLSLTENHNTKIGGEVYSFGSETADFQLGYALRSNGFKDKIPRPRRVLELAHLDIVSISAGRFHSLALTRSGLLYSWGHGRGGRLGHGDELVRIQPTVIESLTSEHIVCCSAGENHSGALSSKGAVYCWGSDRFGQLGIGKPNSHASRDPPCRFSPRRLEVLKKQRLVSLCAAAMHTAAISDNGTLYSWGCNNNGQLMRPTDKSGHVSTCHDNSSHNSGRDLASCDPTPKAVPGFGGSAGSRRAIQVSTGPLGSVILSSILTDRGTREERAVYQSGHGSWAPSKVPFGPWSSSTHSDDRHGWNTNSISTPFITQVSCGRHHSVALSSHGRVYTWGRGVDALGTPNSPPSLVQPLLVEALLQECGGANAVQVQACESRTCVVTDQGSLFTWGCSNQVGTLGLGADTGGGRWQPNPSRIGKMARAVHVALAPDHTLVISHFDPPNTAFFDDRFHHEKFCALNFDKTSLKETTHDNSDDDAVSSYSCEEEEEVGGWVVFKKDDIEVEEDDIEVEEYGENDDDDNAIMSPELNDRILQDITLSTSQKEALLRVSCPKIKNHEIGQVEVTEKLVVEKERSRVPSLQTLCEHMVSTLVDIENVTSIHSFSNLYSCSKLSEFTSKFLSRNMDAVLLMTKRNWRNLVLEDSSEELNTLTSDIEAADEVTFGRPFSPSFTDKVNRLPIVRTIDLSGSDNELIGGQNELCSLNKKIQHISYSIESLQQKRESLRLDSSGASYGSIDAEIHQRQEKLSLLEKKKERLVTRQQKKQSQSKYIDQTKHQKGNITVKDKADDEMLIKTSYYCEVCNVRTQNSSTYASHLLGKKHRTRLVACSQTSNPALGSQSVMNPQVSLDSNDSSALLRSSYPQCLVEPSTFQEEEETSLWIEASPQPSSKKGKPHPVTTEVESEIEERNISVNIEPITETYPGSLTSITLGDFITSRKGKKNMIERELALTDEPQRWGGGELVGNEAPTAKSLLEIVAEEEALRQAAQRHENRYEHSENLSPPKQKKKGATHQDSRWFVPRSASALAVSDIIALEQEAQEKEQASIQAKEKESHEMSQAIALVAKLQAEEKELKLKWPCEVCTFANKSSDMICEMCRANKPLKKSRAKGGGGTKKKSNKQQNNKLIQTSNQVDDKPNQKDHHRNRKPKQNKQTKPKSSEYSESSSKPMLSATSPCFCPSSTLP